ncbi:MAG: hypothetical protein J6Y36_06800 [Treponema sp.]|nr:hypothetical protein [Treponema sp.]
MKKNLFKIIACSIIALSALSCTPGNSSNDVLRINLPSEPDSFFPWKNSAADTKAILYNIFEGLMTFDKDGKIKPCLAKEYSVSVDGLIYSFTIRDDVYFHNGQKLTTEDVLYTYQNLAGINGYEPKSDELQIIKNAWTKDDNIFEVELKKPSASFLTFAISPILQKGYEENEKQPVGTGPYKFAEYSIHQRVVLEKNEAYWNTEKKPAIKRIELYIISDEASCLSALQSDQLDAVQMVMAGNAKTLSKEFNMIMYPQNMVQIFAMNNSVKPFDDPRVRKAICLAINKKEIIEGAMDGAGTELYSNFSPVLNIFYNDRLEKINPYDIKKAKKLLKEAGYENGFNIKITVPANYSVHVDTAQIIAKQLEKIGITCQINGIEWTTWLSDVYTNRQYETTVIAFGGKLEPNDILKRYTSSYKKNFVCFYNSEFDRNFNDALTELDEAKRIEMYKECQKILAEDCPCAFISDPNNTVLLKKNLKGFTYYPISYYDFSSMYFE